MMINRNECKVFICMNLNNIIIHMVFIIKLQIYQELCISQTI